LYFGLGGCFSNLAIAQNIPPPGPRKDLFTIWMAGVYKDVKSLKREVNGFVLDKRIISAGVGVENVGIYDGSKLLAVTDRTGLYCANILLDIEYTLTPKKGDLAFYPHSIFLLLDPLFGVFYTLPIPKELLIKIFWNIPIPA
jgi:hypothetical protein